MGLSLPPEVGRPPGAPKSPSQAHHGALQLQVRGLRAGPLSELMTEAQRPFLPALEGNTLRSETSACPGSPRLIIAGLTQSLRAD